MAWLLSLWSDSAEIYVSISQVVFSWMKNLLMVLAIFSFLPAASFLCRRRSSLAIDSGLGDTLWGIKKRVAAIWPKERKKWRGKSKENRSRGGKAMACLCWQPC